MANSPTTALDIDAQKDAWEIEKGREMTIEEYDKLTKDVIDSIVADYERAYNKELEKAEKQADKVRKAILKAAERKGKPITPELQKEADTMADKKKQDVLWTNPNSTDIRAVKSPRMVAAYLSKYIAKDIDNNPALNDYNNEIEQYKAAMKQWRKEAENLQKRGEDYSFAMELWQQNKDALDKYRREKCPIKGRMWFKSQSLTVFLKGVQTLDPDGKKRYYNYEQMDNDYIRELNDLEKYLDAQEKEVNRERAARAAEAAYRGDKPVLAMCYNEPVIRHLSISYGVIPFYQERKENEDKRHYFLQALRTLLDNGYLHLEDKVAYLSGGGKRGTGATFLEINTIENIFADKSGVTQLS